MRTHRLAGRPKPRIRDSSDEDSDDSNESNVRRVRGQSPDLPFVQLGSPDSDKSSPSAPSPLPVTQSFTLPPSAPVLPPPPAVASAPAPVSTAASSATGQPVSGRFEIALHCTCLTPSSGSRQPLPWMQRAAAALRAKQVDDRFEIIPRPRPPDPSLQEWRIRCLDCPGKVSVEADNWRLFISSESQAWN